MLMAAIYAHLQDQFMVTVGLNTGRTRQSKSDYKIFQRRKMFHGTLVQR